MGGGGGGGLDGQWLYSIFDKRRYQRPSFGTLHLRLILTELRTYDDFISQFDLLYTYLMSDNSLIEWRD